MVKESAISSGHVRRCAWWTVIALWLLGLVGMGWWTAKYEFAVDARAGDIVRRWPSDSSIVPCQDRPTMLLFVHPHCPCTRATIRELQRVLEGSQVTADELPDLTLVVTHPPGADADWLTSNTVEKALQLPRAQVFVDSVGTESARFGAVTSGTVMLFSPSHERVFAGGVTASRGHEGDNPGATMLRDQLLSKVGTSTVVMPAFGCRLCLPACDGITTCSAPRPPATKSVFLKSQQNEYD